MSVPLYYFSSEEFWISKQWKFHYYQKKLMNKCNLKAIKRNGYSFKGDNSSKIGLSSFWKGDYSKRKEREQILSFQSGPPFQKGLGVQESRQEVTKVVSLVKMAENLPFIKSPLNACDMLNLADKSAQSNENRKYSWIKIEVWEVLTKLL